MDKLKIIFMGTPEFGLSILKSLNENYDVIGVVCQPDKPSNRGIIKYCPIKEYAIENNIKVFQPIKIREDYSDILELNPTMIITCAYGQIIPDDILKFPLYGCINIHASLLPKLRGGAPIHRAIIDGYDKTGITIMNMSSKMDAGDIISQESIPILDTDNAGLLHDKLSLLGRDLILKTIPDIVSGNINPIKQEESEVTYAWNIKREDEHIDYMKSTREIVNLIRGLNPWPGAYSILDGKIIKIWSARYGSGVYDNRITGEITNIYEDGIGIRTENGEVIITELQIEGKRRMNVVDYLNGVSNKGSLVGRILE